MNRPDALHPPVAPTAISRPWLARLHPGLFGMVLGLLGLSGAWQRLAHMEVGGAAQVSMVLLVLAVGLLVLLLVTVGRQGAALPGVVRQEWSHPVQGALLALLAGEHPDGGGACWCPAHPEVAGVAFPVAMLALGVSGNDGLACGGGLVHRADTRLNW
jgi:tellurite resistance protein TehA-like permease